MIRVVSFDVGGTLLGFNSGTSFLKSLEDLTGIDYKILKKYVVEYLTRQTVNFNELCRLIGYNSPDKLIQLVELHQLKRKPYLYGDAQILIKYLYEKGLMLVTCSNNFFWNAGTLRNLGLHKYLSFEVNSFEIGFRKPELGFFRHVESLTGAEPEEIVHIGDSLSSDIYGAQQAAWHNVLIIREADINKPSSSDPFVIPEYKITSLGEVVSVICDINARS